MHSIGVQNYLGHIGQQLILVSAAVANDVPPILLYIHDQFMNQIRNKVGLNINFDI